MYSWYSYVIDRSVIIDFAIILYTNNYFYCQFVVITYQKAYKKFTLICTVWKHLSREFRITDCTEMQYINGFMYFDAKTIVREIICTIL